MTLSLGTQSVQITNANFNSATVTYSIAPALGVDLAALSWLFIGTSSNGTVGAIDPSDLFPGCDTGIPYFGFIDIADNAHLDQHIGGTTGKLAVNQFGYLVPLPGSTPFVLKTGHCSIAISLVSASGRVVSNTIALMVNEALYTPP